MASSQKTTTRSSTVLLVIIIGVAAVAAGYFIFFAPRHDGTQIAPNEESTPNFSGIKSVELQLVDETKTKATYTLARGAESSEEPLKLASGILTPLQGYHLEKLQDGIKQSDVSLVLYEVSDDLKDTSLVKIFQEQDELVKANYQSKGEALNYTRIGTPPTATVAMSDGQKAVLATLKRAAVVEKEGQEATTYEMLSGVKIGKQVLLVHYRTDKESQLTDEGLRDALSQVRLKTR